MKSPTRRTSWDDVLDEIWEIVFHGLGGRLESVSLVSKRFLTIAGGLHAALTLPSSTFPILPSRIQSRFPNLRSLHLAHPHPDLPAFISQIATTNLPLRSLRLSWQSRFPGPAMRLLGRSAVRATLQSLSCMYFDLITDDDLVIVADCFPYLRRLDLVPKYIASPEISISDPGILALSIKLAHLVSFNTRFHQLATSRSIEHLSSNCPRLARFKAQFDSRIPVHLHYFSSFPSLLSLDLHRVAISQSDLAQLTRANFKLLESLALSNPLFIGDVTMATLCGFFKSCSSLRRLKLKYMGFHSDTLGVALAKSIPNVRVLSICNAELSETLLFDLLELCPRLEELVLTLSYIGIVDYEEDDDNRPPVHLGLRKLVLAGNELSDEDLIAVAPCCPNLESFYFSHMDEITEVGIESMKANCPNLKICEQFLPGEWKKRGVHDLKWFEL